MALPPPSALVSLSNGWRMTPRRVFSLLALLAIVVLLLMSSPSSEPDSSSPAATSSTKKQHENKASAAVPVAVSVDAEPVKEEVLVAERPIFPTKPSPPKKAPAAIDERLGAGAAADDAHEAKNGPVAERPAAAVDDAHDHPVAAENAHNDIDESEVDPPVRNDSHHEGAPTSPPPVFVKQPSEYGPLYDPKLPVDTATSVLVLIPTAPSAADALARKNVRSTWGNKMRGARPALPLIPPAPGVPASHGVGRLFFLVGTKGQPASVIAALEAEARATGDMVLLPHFTESYAGLSAKMIEVHNWVRDNRARAWPALRYVFKTDTDAWLNVPALFNMIATAPSEKTVIGYKYLHNTRQMQGKWANPEYSSPIYPQYAAGAGYLYTPDIADWVSINARSGWLKPLPNEDAVLGIWLAGTHVQWIHSRYFKPLVERARRITRLPSYLCDDRDILIHHLTDEGVSNLQHWFETCGSPCEATCMAKEREREQKKM
ncbi:galactosyltransferase-domain-containing protein [Blastocladiella britannica]|nr:galactosyltransferase-domain-containing protein [Blastocladiella britannica]